MEFMDSLAIQAYHQQRIRSFGADDQKSLGWKHPEGQRARFDVLTSIASLDEASVLDAGCGHGDLRAYLSEHFRNVRYVGIDHLDAFIDVAIGKYGTLPDTAFFTGDFSAAELPVMDYILACGALSYRQTDPENVYRIIAKLFAACRLGLAFNMLSSIDGDGILVAYDPETVHRYCLELTPYVVLKQGYYESDFTLMLYHNDPAEADKK